MFAMGGGAGRLRRELAADVVSCGLRAGPEDSEPVTEADLADLPGVVRRYLRYMGVVGRPADWSFRLRTTGRFRMRPGQPWLRCQTWQYNSALEVARLFHIRVVFAGLVPMVARDAYLRGAGSMRGKLLGLVRVIDGSGPEFDVSELVTYLNDCVMLAPGMLLRLPVSWREAGDQSFEVTLEDRGLRVSAVVRLDEDGAPVDFVTEDRYAALAEGLVRTRWSTPGDGWRMVNGRPLPSRGQAVWHLPDGEFTYADLEFAPGAAEYNLSPTDAGR